MYQSKALLMSFILGMIAKVTWTLNFSIIPETSIKYANGKLFSCMCNYQTTPVIIYWISNKISLVIISLIFQMKALKIMTCTNYIINLYIK